MMKCLIDEYIYVLCYMLMLLEKGSVSVDLCYVSYTLMMKVLIKISLNHVSVLNFPFIMVFPWPPYLLLNFASPFLFLFD